MKEEYEIEDLWFPLEIHPETPKKGVDILKRFPRASLDRMTANLNASGQKYGIEFKELKLLLNSHLALETGEYGKDKGNFGKIHEKIFRAYFTDGRDIGDLETILDLAQEIGMGRNELKERLRDGYYDKILEETQTAAHEYDINSTPTFIIDGSYVIVGAQPIEVFRRALDKLDK